jgi:anti-anti-sigma factor
MTKYVAPTATVSPPSPLLGDGSGQRTVVWLTGEHDVASRADLDATMDRAADLGDGDVALDLCGVTFMGASTAGAIVVARNHLLSTGRRLVVCEPSRLALRVLTACGLQDLVERAPAPALHTWVLVPTAQTARVAHRAPS